MKTLFFDVETTGLSPAKHCLHQLSGIYLENGEEIKRIDIKVAPYEKAIIEDEALEVSKVTREELSQRQSFADGFKEFNVILDSWVNKFDKKDKIELVGYNNLAFDNNFLRGFFLINQCNYFGSYFHQQTRDVYALAVECLHPFRGELKDFKLTTVAKFLGVEVIDDNAHDAVYDVHLTIQVYVELRKRFFKTIS